MSLYLIHSAKGTTWANHKYKKIANGKYIYDEKGDSKTEEAENEEEQIVDDEETKTTYKKSTKSTKALRTEAINKLANGIMSGKITADDLRKSNGGKDYIDTLNAVNKKFKKPSGSGSSSKTKDDKKTEEKKSSEKSTNASKTAETKEETKTTKAENSAALKLNTVTAPTTEETKTENTSSVDTEVTNNIKSAVKNATNISDNDSIYATKNSDGTTTVRVDYTDGTTQTFILNQEYDVVSKGDKTKRQLTHSEEYKAMSDRFGLTGNYIVHSAKGTSWEKKEHKYISKKRGKDGKIIYIYTPISKSDDVLTEIGIKGTIQDRYARKEIKRNIDLLNMLYNREDSKINKEVIKAISTLERKNKELEAMANGKKHKEYLDREDNEKDFYGDITRLALKEDLKSKRRN